MKEIEITYRTVKVPEEIKVDGKTYPNNKRNHDIVRKYEETGDENVLEELIDFSLSF